MEPIISNLVTQFEKGSLSRRDLVRGLAMLAASGAAGTAAAAQDEIDFKTANIDHVSMQVADLQRSVDFYQKMFGFSVVSEDKPLGIIRLGTNRTLVSFNRQSPVGIVDHFAIGVPRFTKETAARYLTQRGARVGDDPYHGLHTNDPDGNYVQISPQR
jgi:catechol 2,3-dioxygenase-like lactoylglutathione lyase family enzyme